MMFIILENLGYDGIIATKYESSSEAEEVFNTRLKEKQEWKSKYPGGDEGIVLLEAKVVLSNHEEFIFDD